MTSCTPWYRPCSVVKPFVFVQSYDIVVHIFEYLHIKKNVASAVDSPSGIRMNSKRPSGVKNAVFTLSCGDILTCQYLLRRSRVLKYLL